MNSKLLSIIIIEYHSVMEIERCVKSVSQQCGGIDYEIIVSSNSLYKKEKRTELVKNSPSVAWLFNEKNGGFAYGMNEGLKHAKGKYLIISNPDTTILGGLSSLIEFMEEHPFVGASAPQILDENGNIQDSCRPYVTFPRFIWRQLKRILFHKESILQSQFDYSRVQTVDWVIGAFIIVSRAAYRATGGLDNLFFMYAEDLDWCTRIREAGYEVTYFPKMQVRYKGSRAARSSRKYAKVFLKSHIGYWKKYGFIWGFPKRRKVKFDKLLS